MKKTVLFIVVTGTFLLSIIIIVFVSFTKNTKEVIITKAEGNDCDLCINEPPCCGEIRSTGDAHACEWPTRGWCNLDTCSKIEGKGERCGWYWIWHDANDNDYKLGTNGTNGYGCMIGESQSSMRPRCTPAGAITLAPTSAAPPPTQYVPPPAPTSAPLSPEQPVVFSPIAEPTSIIRVPPNEPPPPMITNTFSGQPKGESVLQQFEFPSIQLPNIPLPKIQLNLVKINQNARKPLDFFGYLFEQVVYYDRLLESTINQQLNKIIK